MAWDAISTSLSFFPVIGLAALGGFISQKSGVWNIAVEGIMTFGAFAGILAYHYLAPSIEVALLVGFLASLTFGVLLALLCVHRGLDQLVVGFGLWFLAEGLAGFLYLALLPSVTVTTPFGPKVLALDPLFYGTMTAFAGLYVILQHTRWGLAIRAVGESARAADAVGIPVARTRGICTTVGAGLMGVAGSYLALVVLQGFTYNLVAGYGWAAFALVLFGRWTVPGTLLSPLGFTLLIGLQTRLQVAGILILPAELIVVTPHIAVVAALALAGALGKKSGMPAALGRHYRKEG